MKQESSPARHLMSFRATLLSTNDLAPDEIGIPNIILSRFIETENLHLMSVTIKRDPVLTSKAIHMASKVKRVEGICVLVHSTLYNSMHADIDGDTLTFTIFTSESTVCEVSLKLSPRISMYRHFNGTCLEFAQPHIIRAHAKEELLNSHPKYGPIYMRSKHFHGSNTSKRLNETLLTITQQCGSSAAYDFVDTVLKICFNDENSSFIIHNINDEVCQNIVTSGAKGSKDMLNAINLWFPYEANTWTQQSFDYAKQFINSNNYIATESYSVTQMVQTLQCVCVNADFNLEIKIDDSTWILGHVIDFMSKTCLMSPLTAISIDDNLAPVVDRTKCIDN
jgi:hypothetical protein